MKNNETKVYAVAKVTVGGMVSVKLVTKDVDYACEVAEELGVEYTVVETIMED